MVRCVSKIWDEIEEHHSKLINGDFDKKKSTCPVVMVLLLAKFATSFRNTALMDSIRQALRSKIWQTTEWEFRIENNSLKCRWIQIKFRSSGTIFHVVEVHDVICCIMMHWLFHYVASLWQPSWSMMILQNDHTSQALLSKTELRSFAFNCKENTRSNSRFHMLWGQKIYEKEILECTVYGETCKKKRNDRIICKSDLPV